MPVGQAVHEVPTGATEYWPAAQLVQVRSVVVVQLAALLDVPAGHTVQALHEVALAADQVLPATQLVHLVLLEAVQVAAR